jgi:hypothetical protein
LLSTRTSENDVAKHKNKGKRGSEHIDNDYWGC